MQKILTIKDEHKWLKYLEQIPINQQDIYYTPGYYKVYQNYGDGEAICFIYQENQNLAIYPFFKNSINSLGYNLDKEYFDIQGVYGYNGVIANCTTYEFRMQFFNAFEQYCTSNNIIAEFTRFNPLIKNAEFSRNFMEIILDRNTVFLTLSETEKAIWDKSYSSKNRNMIRKALKNNISVIESDKSEDYSEFYSLYVETMRNVDSSEYLYFNEQYFHNLRQLLPKNHRLILAKHDDKTIGGMILLYSQNYAHYHLSCRKKEFGKHAINNLFLDYAIKLAKKDNKYNFHLGGGTTPEKEDSLLKFKLNFSREMCEFFIGKKIHNKDIYQQIKKQWIEKHPESYNYHKVKLLGYREINEN